VREKNYSGGILNRQKDRFGILVQEKGLKSFFFFFPFISSIIFQRKLYPGFKLLKFNNFIFFFFKFNFAHRSFSSFGFFFFFSLSFKLFFLCFSKICKRFFLNFIRCLNFFFYFIILGNYSRG
jgi:hypothetical protein